MPGSGFFGEAVRHSKPSGIEKHPLAGRVRKMLHRDRSHSLFLLVARKACGLHWNGVPDRARIIACVAREYFEAV